ncbi:hypothetical protein AGMMS50212_07970 [Spirochaetia bacterium]|nr:hypothetical protein AGMMS50212_07970 [Spirochaetia bacterium]
MQIIIDGKIADIKLDIEKTLGDVFSGLELWLEDLGQCISGFEIDGGAYSDGFDLLFEKDLNGIKELWIITTPVNVLFFDALNRAKAALDSLSKENSGNEKQLDEWKKSAGASFLSERDTALYALICAAFSSGDKGLALSEIEERHKELLNPEAEFLSMEHDVDEIIKRLEDYSLDMQTGNDKKSAQTVVLFSTIAEKLFRLLHIMNSRKNDLLDEFTQVLKEFLVSYENNDMILSGDLAEYEIAPRLKKLFDLLKNNANSFEESA